jgi:hypothetical protein
MKLEIIQNVDVYKFDFLIDRKINNENAVKDAV